MVLVKLTGLQTVYGIRLVIVVGTILHTVYGICLVRHCLTMWQTR